MTEEERENPEQKIPELDKTIKALRKRISEFVADYKMASENNDYHKLYDVKDSFLAFLSYSRDQEVLSADVKGLLSMKKDSCKATVYMAEKKDKEQGKTDVICKFKADMACANEAMNEHIADILNKSLKAINKTAEDYLNQIIQRISSLKKEEFGSRNVTT